MDQLFIINCRQCYSVIGDSNMLWLMFEEYALVLRTIRTVEILSENRNSVIECQKCHFALGIRDATSQDKLYRNTIMLYTDKCNFILVPTIISKRSLAIMENNNVKQIRKKMERKVAKLESIK